MFDQKKICVVIPCYRVKRHIAAVISSIPDYVDSIVAVDDCCPENSGKYIQSEIRDARVTVVFGKTNQGVGGAVIAGYQEAIRLQMDIVVKVDGDNQMDLGLLPQFLKPISEGKADYTKGNRFYWFDGLQRMPALRIFGNSGLSIINKLSSGYWDVMDPTNGYTAIGIESLIRLPLEKIERRYFFESDMLFRLGLVRAKVSDVPMTAKYEDEVSNLNPFNSLLTFPPKYLGRFFKRITYMYFLRDFNVGSIFLVSGLPCLLFGLVFGIYKWVQATQNGVSTPVGTLFIVALSLIFGMQFLMGFLIVDVQNTPSKRN